MSAYTMRMARVEIDDQGDWILSVAGTGIRKVIWNDEDLPYPGFPGNAAGHRLIELGWMPDRRAMYGLPGMTPVQKLAATSWAGWKPSEAEKNVWTIPCYHEDED